MGGAQTGSFPVDNQGQCGRKKLRASLPRPARKAVQNDEIKDLSRQLAGVP